MDEGGHYYTVYYTSLAVGFNAQIAYQHALLCQMPDEISWLDAAHLHTSQCFNQNVPNFAGNNQLVPSDWRYSIQYGLHSLPNRDFNANTRSSSYQRAQTTRALQRENAGSLEFGLLLHRLGDTYAHSKIGEENTMYTVTATDRCLTTLIPHPLSSFGHLTAWHDPDYAFLRQSLFFSYLDNLYTVLLNKLQEPESTSYRSGSAARPYHQVQNDFKNIFTEVENKAAQEYAILNNAIAPYARSRGARAPAISKEKKATWLINFIRNATLRNLNVTMAPYKPENHESLTLEQFLNQHPQLNQLNINRNSIERAVNLGIPPDATPPPTMYDRMLGIAGQVDREIRNIYRLP
jgi:hypothetical protein